MRRLLLCLGLVSSPALADDGKPNPEGEYGGVQPGQPKKPETGKKAKKPAPKGTLSWIGFEAKDGGSQVFLQSAAPFELAQRMDGSTLVVTLTGVSRLGGNTWRYIDTRFFETSLAKIAPKKKAKSIEIRITFKNPKDAEQGSVRTATEADGLYYAYLSFSGTGSPPAETTTAPK
jgi:hypothetical protein